MDFDYRAVSLDQIQVDDATYRISTGHDHHALFASIRSLGLIHPPILLPSEDSFVIISGFRRITACRDLNMRKILAGCLPADTPLKICAQIAVADNALQRELNVVELARAIALLAGAMDHADEQLAYLESLGISMNRAMLDKIGRINSMDARLQHGLLQGTISLPTALRLHSKSVSADVAAISSVLNMLDVSTNRQREILDWLEGIAMREGIAEIDILSSEPFDQWLHDPEMDKGHLARLIRRYLKQRRYPEITAFEESYQRQVKALNLPKQMQLIPPPHFESHRFGLRVDFSSSRELEQLAERIRELADSPVLTDVLNPAGKSGK